MLIGISGGIGSGKSVVSRILRLKGMTVYDCDSEAKRLMADSHKIKERIRDEISPQVTDGERIPDRALLAEIIFNDETARKKLNTIVHGAVRDDVLKRMATERILWVEAAILAESGLAEFCDRIWKIVTPTDLRISNVVNRDGCSVEHAFKRLRSQESEQHLHIKYENKTDMIFNNSQSSLLFQIEELLRDVVAY